MARPRSTPPPVAPPAMPAAGPVTPRPRGKVRRVLEAVDGASQLIDLFVAVGRLGGAVLRGAGALLRVFD